ncbi:MAG: chemotaxis protein CheA [Leptospira sp.]|nr:chemotaxis protein CheA [Leptospira sp.]
MDLSEVIDAYIIESKELLVNMEEILLDMEKKNPTSEDLNALFRSVHTIKGTAGMFGFDQTVKFAHKVENLLDDVREGKVNYTKQLTDLLLQVKDQLDYLVQAEPIKNISDERTKIGQNLLSSIEPLLAVNNSKETISIQNEKLDSIQSQNSNSPSLVNSNYLISFRPYASVFQSGLDPYSFIVYLKKLGKITYLKTITNNFPVLESFNPEECYLGFEILFSSKEDIQKIRNAFDFVESDSFLHILPPLAEIEDLVSLAGQLPEEEIYLGNVWKEMGMINEKELVTYLKILSGENQNLESLNSISQNQLSNESTTQSNKSETNAKGGTLRVDAKRVDTLINRVGELVVASANLNQSVSGKNDSALQESAMLVSRLLNEVREISLKLRMVPIGDVLQKYQRIVRDLANDLSKEINLHIEGKDTELDRNIVDKLGDPLVHIVRNACDHGLESPEERIRNGKPKAGNLWINAYHDTGSVVIEIRDDGRGIQSDLVWQKAIEKGLASGLKPDSEEEIFKFLFHPGFSTASSITNVSGRGVGLDVVHKNIESLRGLVQIKSTFGKGSSFLIRLPLTLAIIDGFLVGVGSSYYILPMEMVLECLEFNIESNDLQNQYFPLRGSLIPYIKMKDVFEIEEPSVNARQNIVIVRSGDKKAGIVVEKLFGEFQTVIKPMGSVFQNVRGVSGSSILADGRVALIVDLPSLFQRTINLEKIKQ